jgi:diguanylate cyclase (GGDEF)-like protein
MRPPLPHALDFRRQATLGLGVVALALLTPFAINNLVQQRWALGIGAVAIVLMLTGHAWSASRGRYYPMVTLVGLVPLLLFLLQLSIRTQGVVGVLWCYPTVIAFYSLLPERQAWAADALVILVAVPVAWTTLPVPLVARVAATLVAVSVFAGIFVGVISAQKRQLQAQAVTDPLTGLSNRNLLEATLAQAVAQFGRTSSPVTLLTLDLDRFKDVNDTHGHHAGDLVLKSVGDLLRRRVRQSDRVFRLGGDEFVIVLYNTGPDQARGFVRELQSAIAGLVAVPGARVTASAGVTALRAGEGWDTWMKRGDARLYEAKPAHPYNSRQLPWL